MYLIVQDTAPFQGTCFPSHELQTLHRGYLHKESTLACTSSALPFCFVHLPSLQIFCVFPKGVMFDPGFLCAWWNGERREV